jgi:Leucine-rich repeat (LRR) protein
MIAHVTKEAFNACPLEHLENCPLGQEVSACELFGRLSQLFKKNYGIGLDFTRSLDSLTEQIQELQMKQQQIHDTDLCAIWPKIRAQLPSTVASAPSPTATANEIRAWMMDPANAAHLTSITRLDLNSLCLKTIPPEIGQLSKLTQLDLSYNQITSIPDAIGQLSQLSQLVLSNNQITSIPDVIGQLSQLSYLHLSTNQITSIPDAIGKLSQLSYLYLNNNQITSIPDAIGKLSQLSQLVLSNNQITSIPDAIGQLSKLSYLFLANNQITSIPDAIVKLSELSYLHFNNNHITSIPDAIVKLSELSYLYFNNNQITSIPETIRQLSKLSSLYLSDNQITSIPDAIGKLSQLSSLDLSRNQITSIPDAIGQLSKLSYLYLNNNPILCVTKSVLTSFRRNNYTIKTFSEALQWRAQSALAKLCLAIMQDGGQAMQNMPALLSHLSPEERERIFFHIWNLNQPSKMPDVQWGEHHALDDPKLFMRAVHRSIVGHLEALSQDQRNVVYRKIGQLAGKSETEALQWGKDHAAENLPCLADALTGLKIINNEDV